jgi:hypothetical protein
MPLNPEIVDALVEQLDNAAARMEIAAAVEHAFEVHRALDHRLARDEIKALKRDAEKLVEAIGVFENTVQKSTANLHDFLMTPPWERSRIMSQDDLTAERISYKKALLNPLLQMRADCERVVAQIADEQTSGPEFDRGQRFCATLAYRVMERFSDRPITR